MTAKTKAAYRAGYRAACHDINSKILAFIGETIEKYDGADTELDQIKDPFTRGGLTVAGIIAGMIMETFQEGGNNDGQN